MSIFVVRKVFYHFSLLFDNFFIKLSYVREYLINFNFIFFEIYHLIVEISFQEVSRNLHDDSLIISKDDISFVFEQETLLCFEPLYD